MVLVQVDLPSWVNFPDYERVNWVNNIVGKVPPRPCLASNAAYFGSLITHPLSLFFVAYTA